MKSLLLFTTTSSHVVPGACHHAQQKDQNERQGPVRFTCGNGKKHTPIIPLRSKTEESSLQNAHMHIICILVNLTGYDSQFLYTSSIYLSFWSHGDIYGPSIPWLNPIVHLHIECKLEIIPKARRNGSFVIGFRTLVQYIHQSYARLVHHHCHWWSK